jgi:hypothetical protein
MLERADVGPGVIDASGQACQLTVILDEHVFSNQQSPLLGSNDKHRTCNPVHAKHSVDSGEWMNLLVY